MLVTFFTCEVGQLAGLGVLEVKHASTVIKESVVVTVHIPPIEAHL